MGALEEEEGVAVVAAEPTMMSREARQLMLSGKGAQGLEMWKVCGSVLRAAVCAPHPPPHSQNDTQTRKHTILLSYFPRRGVLYDHTHIAESSHFPRTAGAVRSRSAGLFLNPEYRNDHSLTLSLTHTHTLLSHHTFPGPLVR